MIYHHEYVNQYYPGKKKKKKKNSNCVDILQVLRDFKQNAISPEHVSTPVYPSVTSPNCRQ